jgi:exonuclease SbcD
MRVLHTADWHLGQHFLTGQERLTEQKAFLNWLLATVQAEGVEALVLAGDVFDTTTPSHAAQELYYDFLVRMQGTSCRDIVVVGGNHDSPCSMPAAGCCGRCASTLSAGCRPRLGSRLFRYQTPAGSRA